MERRKKALALRAFIVAAVLLMPIGSPGDKVALIFFSMFLMAGGIRRAFRALMHRSPPLMIAMYSSIAIAGTWANSRYRLGGGPFHLALGSDWRGYPFPFEESVLVSNGTLWRDFCWNGLLGDVFFVLMGCAAVTHFVRPGIAQVPRILLLSAYSGAYAWLNVEVWLFGAPALFIEGPNDIHDQLQYCQTATVGFPLVYWQFDGGRHMWALFANVAIGIAGWCFLYTVLRWARRYAMTSHARTESGG